MAVALQTGRTALALKLWQEADARGREITISARPGSAFDRGAPAFEPLITAAAREHGVSDELIRAIIQTESEFDPSALSPRGACGLMQIMPPVARQFGVVDCFDARENITAGTRHLRALLKRYDGSIALSVAAYNAGEGAVARHGGIPPYRQTRAYVRRVQSLLAARAEARPARSADAT